MNSYVHHFRELICKFNLYPIFGLPVFAYNNIIYEASCLRKYGTEVAGQLLIYVSNALFGAVVEIAALGSKTS